MSRHRLEVPLLERKLLHLTTLYPSNRFHKVKRLHRPQTISHRKEPHLTQPHRPKQRLRPRRTTLTPPRLRKRPSVIHRRARTARSIADVAASQLTLSICSRPRNCVVKQKIVKCNVKGEREKKKRRTTESEGSRGCSKFYMKLALLGKVIEAKGPLIIRELQRGYQARHEQQRLRHQHARHCP